MLFHLSTLKFQLYPWKKFLIICIGCSAYSYRYRLPPIVLIIGTDYAYGRCIGTALIQNNKYCTLNQNHLLKTKAKTVVLDDHGLTARQT